MTKILINGEEKNQVSVYDRAFQYGDGLFETIALRDGKLIYWDEHLQRLNHGCHVLGLEPVAEVSWLNDIKKVIGQQDNAVVKLIYSRGKDNADTSCQKCKSHCVLSWWRH